jgi:hypothetical protein
MPGGDVGEVPGLVAVSVERVVTVSVGRVGWGAIGLLVVPLVTG